MDHTMTGPHQQPDSAAPAWAQLVPPDRPATIVILTAALWIACVGLCYALLKTPVSGDNVGLMKLTESYGALERVALWQQAFSWVPGVSSDTPSTSWPKPLIVWTVRLAMLAMFVLHAFAFAAAWRSRSGNALRWLIGPIGAQVIMLLMVPSNADVFFYAISGDIANRGMNPYTTHLYEVFRNPLYAYNHWVDMTTVYGPVWTLINQGLMWIAGPDPTNAVLGYKLLFGAAAILLAAGVYGAARMLGIAPAPATAAMVLVAWQPNMIIESAGQAHNDVVMLSLVLAGVTLAIAGASRATRGGIVLIVLSAAVKFISLPVLGLLALTRLDRRRNANGPFRIACAWALDAIAIAGVLVAVFAPYWTGSAMLAEMVSEPGRLYSNPIWLMPASAIEVLSANAGTVFEEVTRVAAQVVAICATGLVLVRFGVTVWRNAESADGNTSELATWSRPLLAGWAAIFGILAFVPVNTHAWYWTWPVVPIALLVAWDGGEGARRWPAHWWLGPYLVLTAILTLIYHTRIVHT